MASHAGLITVIKTVKGYITDKGGLTNNIDEARKIYCLEFGFRDAYEVAERLGYHDDELKHADYTYKTVEPSYDSRLAMIESYLEDMGYDYREACEESAYSFRIYHLERMENFRRYIETLKEKTINYYNSRSRASDQVMKDGVLKNLYRINHHHYEYGDYTLDTYYDDEEKIEKYTFHLSNPHVEKYFDVSSGERKSLNNWQSDGLVEYLKENIELPHLDDEFKIYDIRINDGKVEIYTNEYNYHFIEQLNDKIRNFLSQKEMHITRMFGSYIILRREQGELRAIKATPIPIKYCPLMIKLLKEVGGEVAEKLIASLENTDEEEQTKMMCALINEVVIKGGYLDTNRPLNSCEANVTFGASETMSSAFKSKMIDAAVIVSNNLGTIITTNDLGTQGAVKRMTGLFYTSPNETIVKTAEEEGIIPVFPYSAKIDQLKGVEEAIKRGYKRIAVSVAAGDNYLHKELKRLELENNVTIYKFGLCSTGITEETAKIMEEYADVVWSCASSQVRKHIDPASIFQVGVKIPVYVMTEKGYEIIKNHLSLMNDTEALDDIALVKGEEMPVALNNSKGLKLLKRKELHHCADCPHPCI